MNVPFRGLLIQDLSGAVEVQGTNTCICIHNILFSYVHSTSRLRNKTTGVRCSNFEETGIAYQTVMQYPLKSQSYFCY